MEHLGDSWVLGLLTLVLIAAVVGWLFFNAFRLIGPIIAVVAAVVLFFGIAEYNGWIDTNGTTKAASNQTPGLTADQQKLLDGAAAVLKAQADKNKADADAAAAAKNGSGSTKINADLARNPAADQAAADACSSTSDYGHAVSDGTKLANGTCAIVEVDNWSTKTSTIYAGALPQDFLVNDKATPQVSAWVNYSSTTHACKDAQGQKAAREKDPTFKGFTFDVKCSTDSGKSDSQQPSSPGPMAPAVTSKSATRLTGPCGNVPHSDQVMSVNIGEALPKGTLVVVRTSNHADLEIFVEYGCLLADTTFDHVGLIAVDAWYGYSAVAKAQANACGEARARLNGSKTPKSWEEGYNIHFIGPDGKYGDIPATCPAR